MAGLLALVAHTLAGRLRRAVARKMADFAAVVALLALGAVTCPKSVSNTLNCWEWQLTAHVSETAARVAGLPATRSVPAAEAATASAVATTAAAVPATIAAALGAVTRNMADLTTLVAFLPAAGGSAGGSAEAAGPTAGSSRAVTGKVVWGAAVVASLAICQHHLSMVAVASENCAPCP